MSQSKSKRPVILYADDHRDVHTLMNRAFASAGVKAVILPATDGTAVLGYLSKSREKGPDIYPRPDLLLLELRMPKISGLEVMEAMKNSPELPKIPTVIISSSENPADIQKAKELGCRAFVRMHAAMGNLVEFAKALEVEFFGAKESVGQQKFSSFCVML